MYQQYPGSGPQQMPPRPPVPRSVQTAVNFMYAGAVLSFVSMIVSLFTLGSIRDSILKANPNFTSAQVHAAQTTIITAAIIGGLIGTGLWIWMAWANRAGKNWARILSTVFFGINTIGVIVSFSRAHTLITGVIGILVWLAGLGAIIYLWQRQSTAYFQAMP